MCSEAEAQSSYALRYVPNELKTQEMCNEVIREDPGAFFLVPDHFKTQEMCNEALEVDPWQLYDVPDYQEMCDKAVRDYLFSLQFVPDWFVTQQQTDIWYDNNDWHDDNEIIEWYKGYQKRRTQKVQIEKELMPIAWHPSRWWDWCMSEDEKKETEKLWN